MSMPAILIFVFLLIVLFILGRDRGDAFLRAHCSEAEAIWIMSNQEGMPRQ